VVFGLFKRKKKGSGQGGGLTFQFRQEKSEGGMFTGKADPKILPVDKIQMKIGRDIKKNDIVLRHSFVSGEHGTLVKGENSCIFKDHSKNGTWLLRVEQDEQHIHNNMIELMNGDVLEFGRTQDRIFRLYFSAK